MRGEISKFLSRKYGLEYQPKGEVLVTVGGSEGIDNAIRAIVSRGDEVIIPQPSFVCYEPLVRLAGGVPVIIDLKAENEFRLTAAELREKITDKTKMLIFPFPCNPTGAIMEREDLEAIADVLREELWKISLQIAFYGLIFVICLLILGFIIKGIKTLFRKLFKK